MPQAGLALLLHDRQRQRLVLAVIPEVTTEKLARARGELLGAREVAFKISEVVGLPRPKRDLVAPGEVFADREPELVIVQHHPEIERPASRRKLFPNPREFLHRKRGFVGIDGEEIVHHHAGDVGMARRQVDHVLAFARVRLAGSADDGPDDTFQGTKGDRILIERRRRSCARCPATRSCRYGYRRRVPTAKAGLEWSLSSTGDAIQLANVCQRNFQGTNFSLPGAVVVQASFAASFAIDTSFVAYVSGFGSSQPSNAFLIANAKKWLPVGL
jgi:hypothetical protein